MEPIREEVAPSEAPEGDSQEAAEATATKRAAEAASPRAAEAAKEGWMAPVVRLALIALFLWMAWGVMVPIALGAILALLLTPTLHRLTPRMGRAARFAPLLLTFGMLVLVVIPVLYATLEAVQSINDYVTRDWSGAAERFQAFLARGVEIGGFHLHLSNRQLSTVLEEVGQRIAPVVATLARNLVTSLPQMFIGVFLFVVALYYALRDGAIFSRWLYRITPFSARATQELFGSVQLTVNGAIRAMIATALVQGGLTLLALYILHVPNALLLGVLATILSFVPLVGTTPVTFGSAIYLFATGSTGAGIGMLVAAGIVGISDNVVRPWAQSAGGNMHPLLALLGIFGGLALFGTAGVLLGPIVAALAIWCIENYAKLYPPGDKPPPDDEVTALPGASQPPRAPRGEAGIAGE